MYDLLLTTDIHELSMKGIRMQLSDQNCRNQLNLILFFFHISPFVCLDSLSIKQKKRPTFQQS